MGRIGTFGEHVVCPAEMLVPMRKEMPWAPAALLGCCVPTGVGAVTRCAQVEAGASVVVIGCGGVGLNVVQGARLAGARMIVACDLLDNKLAFAKEFGATHTVNAAQADVVETVRGLTGGRGADYAFDAIGSEKTTLQIIDAVRPGGTAVIVGMAPQAARAPINPFLMAVQEKVIKARCTAACARTSTSPGSSSSISTAGSRSTSSSAGRTGSRRSTRASPRCGAARSPGASSSSAEPPARQSAKPTDEQQVGRAPTPVPESPYRRVVVCMRHRVARAPRLRCPCVKGPLCLIA